MKTVFHLFAASAIIAGAVPAQEGLPDKRDCSPARTVPDALPPEMSTDRPDATESPLAATQDL